MQFINNQRAEGEAVLEHYNFLAKVPQVLGSCAGNFSSTYPCAWAERRNPQFPVFHLPQARSLPHGDELQLRLASQGVRLHGIRRACNDAVGRRWGLGAAAWVA